MLQNLERTGASRGFEGWAKLVRDFKGENGPRLLGMVDKLFCPRRVQMSEVPVAMETFQQVMPQFEAAEKHTMSSSLKIFGLMRLLPLELAKDFLRQSGEFQGEYTEARRWILDQLIVRKDNSSAGKNAAHQVDTSVICGVCDQNSSEEEVDWNSLSEEDLSKCRAMLGIGRNFQQKG